MMKTRWINKTVMALLLGLSILFAGVLTQALAEDTAGQPGTVVYREVRFELPADTTEEEAAATRLPDTMMVPDGTPVAAISTPSREGSVFLGWGYDDALAQMAGPEDVVDRDLLLYPRFADATQIDDNYRLNHVADRDVSPKQEITVISYGLPLTDLERTIAVRDMTEGGEAVPFTLEPVEAQAPEENPGEVDWDALDLDAEVLDAVRQAADQLRAGELQENELVEVMDFYQVDAAARETVLRAYAPDAAAQEAPDEAESDEAESDEAESDEAAPVVFEETGRYIVRPARGTWEPGDLHQVEITDTARLRFDYHGEPTDATVCFYNFDVAREEIYNLRLTDGVLHVPARDVEGLSASGGLLQVAADADSAAVQEGPRGTFRYLGDERLSPGMTLAVYEGELQQDGSVAGGSVGYYKVSEDLGEGMFAYEKPDFEDVIFIPDNIPVPDDGTFDDGQVVLRPEQLDFSDPVYEALRLGKDTRVDVGDFMTFYTGDLKDGSAAAGAGSARVTGVEINEDGSLTVSYEPATTADMEGSMQMYLRNDDAEIEITDERRAFITDSVTRQLEQNGVIEQMQTYLAQLIAGDDAVLDSPECAELLRRMRFSTDDGRELTLEDIRRLKSKAPEFEGFKINTLLTPTLNHFAGHKGLRAEFSIGFAITVDLNPLRDTYGIATGQNQMKIKCTVLLEQEVMFSITAQAKLKWGWVLFFYLPKECNVDLGLEVGSYTGAGFVGSLTTQTKDLTEDTAWDDMLGDINRIIGGEDAKALISDAESLKEIAEFCKSSSERISAGLGASTYMDNKDGPLDTDNPESQASGIDGGLADKYVSMLNDSNYVYLFDPIELFSFSFRPDPLQLIELTLTGQFSVSYKLSAMLGCGVSCSADKELSCHIQLFKGEATKTATSLEEPSFQADFYAFGMAGIRAGIDVEAKVGLISTLLDSVGLKASLGVYAEVYGMFYAYYHWGAETKSTYDCMGSLLFEFGIYFDLDLTAQMLGGLIGDEWNLIDGRLPILQLGDESVAVRFKPLDEPLTLEIEKGKASVGVPDEVYEIDMMDLRTGKLKGANKDTGGRGEVNYTWDVGSNTYSQYNEINYIVETHDLTAEDGTPTNKHSFHYLPDSNEIYVMPESTDADEELWGVVTLIYRGGGFGFSTTNMRRSFKVHWQGRTSSAQARYCIQDEGGNDLLR